MRKGITLIELIVVLTILAIILSTGLLSFASTERKILNQAAQELKLELDMTRHMALYYNLRHDILFLYPADRPIFNADFQIIRRYSCWHTSRPRGQLVYTGRLAHGVEVVDVTTGTAIHRRYLGYTGRGTAIYAGSVTIASANYFVRLTVNVGSGFVSIGEIEPRQD